MLIYIYTQQSRKGWVEKKGEGGEKKTGEGGFIICCVGNKGIKRGTKRNKRGIKGKKVGGKEKKKEKQKGGKK